MKYLVPISRTIKREVEVFAPDREAALDAVLKTNPGFTAECVIELNEQDEEGTSHGVFARCEDCGQVIWEGDKYVQDDDGNNLCETCFSKIPGMEDAQ